MLRSGSDIVRGIIRQHRDSLFFTMTIMLVSCPLRRDTDTHAHPDRDFIHRTVVCRNPILHSYCYSTRPVALAAAYTRPLTFPSRDERRTDGTSTDLYVQ